MFTDYSGFISNFHEFTQFFLQPPPGRMQCWWPGESTTALGGSSLSTQVSSMWSSRYLAIWKYRGKQGCERPALLEQSMLHAWEFNQRSTALQSLEG